MYYTTNIIPNMEDAFLIRCHSDKKVPENHMNRIECSHIYLMMREAVVRPTIYTPI